MSPISAPIRFLRVRLTSASGNDSDDIRSAMTIGVAATILLVGGLGGWAASVPLAGAVLAPGTVVVDGSVKKVQHTTGGRASEIRVKDGDRVAREDLLIRLDGTVVRANLQVIVKQMDELAIRRARLAAERDGAAEMTVPPSLEGRENDPDVAAMITAERNLLQTRTAARAGQKAQLRERIAQLREEVAGLAAHRAAKTNEIELVQKELAGAEKLWQQNLMPITKLTALQRDAARLDGERAQLVSQAAQARGRISEIELQAIQVDQDLRAEVSRELRDVQAKEVELAERRVAAEDQLQHLEIRAPVAGVVHQLAVHTVGGVIGPGEAIMQIVPEDDALVIEAKVAPQDIDTVRQGQRAVIRFTAFDHRSTPEMEAVVTQVAADLIKDARPAPPYYTARLLLTGGVNGLRLLPGMPAEVHIPTAERTALAYLLKPLSDQVARAFVER